MTRITIQQAMDLGIQHHGAGNLQQAEAIYRQVLAAEPNHADATHLLGVIAHQAGQNRQARELIERAIRLSPGMPYYHNNLGQVLWELSHREEAVAAFSRAVELNPQYAEALSNLGDALRELRRLDEAIATLGRAVTAKPDFVDAHYNLGRAYRDAMQLDQAAGAYRQAIKLKPDHFFAQLNLAEALHVQRDYETSIAVSRQAIALRPDSAEAWNNLGNSLAWQGKTEQAIDSYRRAIEFRPDLALAHYHLGMALLLRGDFEQGFAEYSWRMKTDLFRSLPQFDRPQWDGGDLNGQRILLHAEQGFGDSIHFVRYAQIAMERGGRVRLRCPRELVRLFRSMPDIEQVLAGGDELPEFDVHCSLMSLPHVCKTTLETVPATVPYLTPDRDLSQIWKQKLSDQSLKVGLVWAGQSIQHNDRNRSISLQALAPLAEVSGVSFHGLQVGEPAAQARAAPPGMNLRDWSADLHDFADTAALMDNLDLIITVDTAAAHLAGALGRPVWVLLCTVADWRWMLDREDSPWYPTMRLFRQSSPGDWRPVIDRVVQSLTTLAGERACRK